MRRIDTDYSNRLPDDFVAVVLTKEEVKVLMLSLMSAGGGGPTSEEEEKLIVQFEKLMEGDKWSES